MDAPSTDKAKRLTLCLVADEDVAERCPSALRYLQVGLIDETIDTLLIAPEQIRRATLDGGPIETVLYDRHGWPLTRWGWRGAIDAAGEKIAALQPDAPIIVHALSAEAAPLALRLAQSVGGDLIVTLAAAAEIHEPAYGRCLSAAAYLIAPTEQIRRAIPASPFGDKPTAVVPLCVVAGSTPRAFSNPQRAPSLVYAGPLSGDCGVETLLRAIRRLLTYHPNLLLVVIGKGPAESNLRHVVESLDLSQNVTFTGRLEQWRAAMEAADIFCLPASQQVCREEPLQALAAGLAVIAAKESVFEGLVDGHTALLFPADDPAELAERIRRLLDDQPFARTLAAAGQTYARSHHSVARMVAEHVRIYRDLATRDKTLRLPASR